MILSNPKSPKNSPPLATLALALAEAAAQARATEITGLSAGYELTGDGVRRLELTPVLVAETDRGRIVLDTVTKKALSGT